MQFKTFVLRPKVWAPLLVAVLVAVGAFMLAQPPRVQTAVVETGRVVQVVYATGSVQPDTATEVAAEVAARITALLVDEGDVVQAGQPLARLDDADARVRLQQAEQQLQTAQARLRQAIAPTDPFVVSQLEAQVQAARERVRAAEDRVNSARESVNTARNAVRAAEANVDSATARLQAQQNGVRAARSEIEAAQERVSAAQADVDQARANVEAARDLYERRRQLLQEKAIAERAVTEARTAYQAAQATERATRNRVEVAQRQVNTARANAAAAESQAADAAAAVAAARANVQVQQAQVGEAQAAVAELRSQVDAARQDADAVASQLGRARRGQRPVDIDIVRAEVRTQEAVVAQMRQDLSKYVVLSPVTGRVTERPVDPGDYVQSGGRLFTVANEQRIYVRADVDEADIGQVRLGAESRFQVDALPGRVYVGHVTRIADTADVATKTYPVEIRNINDTQGLRLGMTADVNIQGRETDAAIVAPTTALVTEAQGTFVWVVTRDQRVQRRPIRFQARDVNSVEVVEGLQVGERIVLNPPGKLRDGQAVRVE